MKKFSLKKNNRGDSMILVITTIALISILVSVILATSLMNMQMKLVNKQSVDNFYDAEEAMDEIRIGLQQLASRASAAAYEEVLETYSVTNNDAEVRKGTFKTAYANKIKTELQNPTDTTKYNLDLLKNYIGVGHRYDSTTGTGAELTIQPGLEPLLVYDSNVGIILENLKITYRNSEDFVSTVKADITIGYPDLNFIQSDDNAELLSYALVGNEGITCDGGNTVTIDGNAYAGNNDSGSGGLKLNAGKCQLLEWRNLIVRGAVTMKSNSQLTSDTDASLWAEDITVEQNAQLSLKGKTYVADNLDIYGGKVTLAGEYYGYGNPTVAKSSNSVDRSSINSTPCNYSSAIQIYPSSSKATLDMSGLEMLMVAGNAYSTDNLRMFGESISVTGLNHLYLAPTDCFYPTSTGQAVSNPFNSATTSLISNAAVYAGTYHANSIMEDIVGTERYYYLVFADENKALAYYKMKMKEDTTFINANLSILQNSVTKITAPTALTDEQLMLNGGVLWWDSATNATSIVCPKVDGVGRIIPNWDYIYKQVAWHDQYHAYQKNLTTSYANLTADEKRKNVFQNLIVTDSAAWSHIPSGTIVKYSYTDGAGITQTALVANGDIDASAYVGLAGEDIGLIIAKGDVTLENSFEGTIICDGTIKINTSGSVSGLSYMANANKAANLLSEATYISGTNEYKLKDLLIDSASYGSSTASSGAGEKIDMAELVTYKNWSKE